MYWFYKFNKHPVRQLFSEQLATKCYVNKSMHIMRQIIKKNFFVNLKHYVSL